MTRGSEELLVFQESAATFDVALTKQHLDLFRLYLEELWAWNEHINITGLTTRESIVTDLFLDSLVPAPFLPTEASLLDVGSGGGFPGVPLKIYMPHLIVHLLEANTKRGSFLKHVIRLLRLKDVRVIRGRIETYGHQMDPLQYNVITARALASPNQTILWCAPLLSPGGFMVLFLGAHPGEELAACEEVMKNHALAVTQCISYSLPGKRTQRSTVLLRRN